MASATGNNLYLLKQSQNRHKELCLLSPIYNAHWTIGISSVHTTVLPCRPIVQLQTFFSLLGSPDLPSTRVPHVPTVAHHATFNQPQFMASESKQKSRFLTCDKLTLHKQQKHTLQCQWLQAHRWLLKILWPYGCKISSKRLGLREWPLICCPKTGQSASIRHKHSRLKCHSPPVNEFNKF